MGRSLGITLPVEFLDELGWREKQRVVVKRIQGGMIIRDRKTRKRKWPLELLATFYQLPPRTTVYWFLAFDNQRLESEKVSSQLNQSTSFEPRKLSLW